MLSTELNRRVSLQELPALLLGAIAGTGGTLYVITSRLRPLEVLIYTVLLWVPAILLHEIAHAVTGRIANGTVANIKLGRSIKTLTGKHKAFRFLGFRWELYGIPLSGLVHVFFTDPHRFRTRIIFMIAAGPAISLTAATTGAVCYRYNLLPALPEVTTGWILVNGYIFLCTAWPFTPAKQNTLSQTDGFRIMKTLSLSDEEVKQKVFLARLHLDLQPEKDQVGKLTLEQAIARHEAAPDRIATLIAVIDKLGEAKDRRQNDYIAKLVTHPRLIPENVARFLDGHLTQALMENRIKHDDRFDALSQRLVSLSKGSLTSLGTRGSILIDLGQIEEGKSILEEVLSKSESVLDQIYSHVFLALAAKEQGNFDLARVHTAKAAAIDSTTVVLSRVADLVNSSTSQTN